MATEALKAVQDDEFTTKEKMIAGLAFAEAMYAAIFLTFQSQGDRALYLRSWGQVNCPSLLD
jgi:hypothetical protein